MPKYLREPPERLQHICALLILDCIGRKRANVAGRTARKTISKGVRKLAKAARKLAVEDRPEEQPPLRRKARKREGVEASSEESDRVPSDVIELTESSSEEDIDQLLDAFNAFTLSEARLQQRRKLPFLLRNLRMGFESRCRTFHIPIGPDEFPTLPVKVVYRYAVHDSDQAESDGSASVQEKKYQEFLGSLTKWACPVCELHKPFRNRLMLAYHLTKDHAEMKISWVGRKVRNVSAFDRTLLHRSLMDIQETLWRIDILIPDADESEEDSIEDSIEDSEDDESESEGLEAPSEDGDVRMDHFR